MKILFGLIYGILLLSGAQLVAPLPAAAAELQSAASSSRPQATLGSTTTIAPQNRVSQLRSEEYNPPDTGGPGKSGGSGTR